MTRLLTVSYRSTSLLRDRTEGVAAILAESLKRNAELGITGLLLFNGYQFMQTIEGCPKAVGEVFVKIIDDPRHDDVVPFGIREMSERQFPDWKMKLIGPNVTMRIVPDLATFDFTDDRLAAVHLAAMKATERGTSQSALCC